MAFTFKHGDRPLEGFTIQRAIGRGGFGEVYYAISDGGREVALKYLRENPEVELRGVSHCINLKSPHLVTIFDVRKSDDGDFFIIMEYVSGPSLRDLLIAEPNGLGPQKTAFFIREIAKGLSYLHDRGIVHRDLKPGNIFYDDGYVKIGDYGLSKFISVSRHSAQTASVGTVHYMAPEVGSGNYARSIDVYALGVILYEMLLGKVPFEGGSMGEVLMKHLTAQPVIDDLPAPYGDVIRKALAKDPNDRYQTVDEMVQELFDVDDVQQSLVGFNPASLSQAAQRAARDLHVSPVPSPNPPPPPAVTATAEARAESDTMLPPRLRRRLSHIEDRVNRRMATLDRRAGGRRAHKPERPPEETPGSDARPVVKKPATVGGFLLGLLIALAVATTAGIIFGTTFDRDETGLVAFFVTITMPVGLGLGRRVIRRIGEPAQPPWVQALIMAAFCALPVAAGAAALESLVRDEGVIGFFAGMAAAVLFVDWDRRAQSGAQGELGLGAAFWAGLWAFIVCAVLSEGSDVSWLTGGIVAGVSLILSAVSWFWPGLYPIGPRRPRTPRHDRPGHRHRRHEIHDDAAARRRHAAESPTPEPPPVAPARQDPNGGPPFATPVQEFGRPARLASTTPPPPLRSGLARAFWSVVAFCLFGIVVSAIVAAATGLIGNRDEIAAAALAGSGAGCALLFALSKTTQRRRPSFYREHARPFFIAAGLFGVIASLALPRILGSPPAEVSAILLVGLVMSATLLLVSFFVGASRHTALLTFILVPIILIALAVVALFGVRSSTVPVRNMPATPTPQIAPRSGVGVNQRIPEIDDAHAEIEARTEQIHAKIRTLMNARTPASGTTDDRK